MTYEESAALMQDLDFRGKVKVALLKYAAYILGEAPNVTAHNARYKWAQGAFLQPDMTAAQIQPPVVMDANVQAAGPAVSDAALQTAVEAVINTII